MFCNYCRSVNPNDAVYCRACGRTIRLALEQGDDQGRQSSTSDESEPLTPEIVDSASVAEPQIVEGIQRDYEVMDDEELSQLQGAYQKLRLPIPPGLLHEVELRAFTKKLEEIEDQPDYENSEIPDDLTAGVDNPYPEEFLASQRRLTEHIKSINQPIPPSVEKVHWWKYLAWRATWLVALVVLLAVGAAFIFGLVWISAKLYPIVEWLSLLGVVVFLVCLPLSIFKRIRRPCGKGLVGVSYLWGLGLWMYSILALYDLWGLAGIYIGFFTLGYVTVPLACLALLFKGEWSLLGQVVLWFLIVFCMRMLGYWIISKAAPEHIE
jgi:hypothetical protein